jgi:hypothetical protein
LEPQVGAHNLALNEQGEGEGIRESIETLVRCSSAEVAEETEPETLESFQLSVKEDLGGLPPDEG